MRENSPAERLYNGIIKENPTFVLVLGMCPTLAVTTAAINGIGMGLTTTVVLMMSNLFISLLRNIIPDKVRMPAYIVIVASFVTVVQLLLEGFIPSLYDSLGLYSPYRSKLYHSGKSGIFRFQEYSCGFHLRRYRHGSWLYPFHYHPGSFP